MMRDRNGNSGCIPVMSGEDFAGVCCGDPRKQQQIVDRIDREKDLFYAIGKKLPPLSRWLLLTPSFLLPCLYRH